MEVNHFRRAATNVATFAGHADEVSMVQVEQASRLMFAAKAHFPVVRSTRTALPDPEVVGLLAVAEGESCGFQRRRYVDHLPSQALQIMTACLFSRIFANATPNRRLGWQRTQKWFAAKLLLPKQWHDKKCTAPQSFGTGGREKSSQPANTLLWCEATQTSATRILEVTSRFAVTQNTITVFTHDRSDGRGY